MNQRVTYIEGIPAATNHADPEFTAITFDQLKAFAYFLPRSPRTWITYVVLLHKAQRCGSRTIRVRPKLYQKAGLSKEAFSKHVKKLEAAEMITVEREPGKALVVTLSEFVPIREKKGGKR